MFFSKQKNRLGVDIGTANIKVVEISGSTKPVLLTYGSVNTAYQLSGKTSQVALEQTAAALRELVARCRVGTKRCAVSFPNSAVFTSVIELPKMPDKDLGSAVEFEAKKYVPLPLAEVDLSWSAIGPAAATGPQPLEKILLTAVPKQVTQSYIQVLQLAGLEPEVAEIEALALIRSLLGGRPESCVIIDVGARATSLNIVENGLLKLTRNLNVGGESITVSIAQQLRIAEVRAEQFKRSYGVSGATFIPEAVKPTLGVVKTEVQQLLALARGQQSPPKKLIITGGGANLPGISGFFEDLGLPVELGDPFASVGYPKSVESVLKRHRLSLAVAVGLALRHD